MRQTQLHGAWLLCMLLGCRASPPGQVPLPTDTGTDSTAPGADAHWTPHSATRPVDTSTSNDTGTLDPAWVHIPGGAYIMGQDGTENANEAPAHEVTIPGFQMLRAEVTAGGYALCVQAGGCTALPDNAHANCMVASDLPRNCVDWFMARDYCTWVGGRLLSESEWEYAARSLGQEHLYPWGNEDPMCEHAVFGGEMATTCGDTGPEAGCSHPLGNTEQGVCDLAGNLFEWVEDWHHATYVGAPVDGSPWIYPEEIYREMRGGGVRSEADVRTYNRTFHEPEFSYSGSGIRCARAVPGDL